eukprot:scaffold138492_cov16-Tisochrysis_lutea.AAC.1
MAAQLLKGSQLAGLTAGFIDAQFCCACRMFRLQLTFHPLFRGCKELKAFSPLHIRNPSLNDSCLAVYL